MRNLIYKIFYGLPLQNIVVIMILLVFVWWILDRIFRRNDFYKNLWKFGNIVMLIGTVVGIVIITIASRSEVTEVILIPLQSFVEARIQPEIYRSMLMNVFLFFPLGLTMPYVLPRKWKRSVLFTILFALAFSVVIEYSQYYFRLGRAETDDVICNTLGCAIGTLSYRLGKK